MKFNNASMFRAGVFGAFLLLLAIFPVSNTIALRNLLLLLLAMVCLVVVFRRLRLQHSLLRTLKSTPWPISLWVTLLLAFPFWAPDSVTAWQSLGGDWFEALLASFVGLAVAYFLGVGGPGLLGLAFASASPLLLHLLLALAASQGLLDAAFYADPTLANVWKSLLQPGMFATNPQLGSRELMGGFRGIEPMHGNLGYPGCQAIALFCVSFVVALREKNVMLQVVALFGTALCFLSILLAQSRGGILYAFLVVMLIFFLRGTRLVKAGTAEPTNALGRPQLRMKYSVLLMVLLLLATTFQYARHDQRWYSMADNVQIGFSLSEPISVLCNGMDVRTKNEIRIRLSDRDPAYVQRVIDGMQSDGGRILIMRAGYQLALENPFGLDGSRHSFRRLIEKRCGQEPVMQFAHAHNGWVDLALALGWVGFLLFACLMGFFLLKGWQGMRNAATAKWGMTLFVIAAFWILRGLTDSVYREHLMQMQLMLLMYLYGRVSLVRVN